eukprot:CAMPEP_0184326388 /NCGR_PEP_ID=MMETSP1049-20130417/142538_1 /TAXON_ID=77928 /ORGANISM="Proteomonas sulcata, Strain CCMP704" /LENGTH=64 /DNA_ID=CAMNT_0026648581 /DNA_START=1096 /DNA_END=1290 /DNA_ORIENTATION=-
MADDAVVLLRDSWQESWHVHQSDDRDVEGIAEADEAASLARGINVKASGQVLRLIGYDPHCSPL